MRNWLVCILAVLAGTPLSAQDGDTKLQFEVASIKECGPFPDRAVHASSPGRLSMGCWPLKRLISDAYEVFANGKVDPLNPAFPFVPLEGLPSWANSTRYAIEAKTAGPQSVAMMRGPIMQKLLEDRFQLRVHRETKEVPVYIMRVGKGGPKLQPSNNDSCNHIDSSATDGSSSPRLKDKPWCVIVPPSRDGESHFVWDVKGMGLDVLASLMLVGRPVIDRTGLTGTYDIRLEWWEGGPSTTENEPATGNIAGTELMRAMSKQLGLQFEAGKGPREFLVIDRLERPSPN